MAWFEAERRVLAGAVAQAPQAGFDIYAWYISWPLARFLELRGPWHEWVIVERTALAATQQLGDRAAQAFAHWQLGYAHARLGDYEASHAQLQQALSIYEELADRVGRRPAHPGHHGSVSGRVRRSAGSFPAGAGVVHRRW